jgi:hypothetical protein
MSEHDWNNLIERHPQAGSKVQINIGLTPQATTSTESKVQISIGLTPPATTSTESKVQISIGLTPPATTSTERPQGSAASNNRERRRDTEQLRETESDHRVWS